MICHIMGAAPGTVLGDLVPKKGDLIIAADGGYRLLCAAGLTPDVVLGDFDSLGEVPLHPHVVRLPVRKDETDMAAAVRVGVERGYSTFRLYGGVGGRPDHTYANQQLLFGMAKHGLHARLFGAGYCMTVLCDGTLTFPAGQRGTVSVFSLTDCSCGVTLSGLSYPLQDATLTNDIPLGVSNQFLPETAASFTVAKGALLIMWELSGTASGYQK